MPAPKIPYPPGLVSRIDQLIAEGERTSRQIAETATVEFEIALPRAKMVVGIRARQCRAKGGAGPRLEDVETRQITYLPANNG